MTTKDEVLKLTERETQLLAATWQCFQDGPPKIDFDKLAKITGYTPGSARYALGGLKKKLKDHAGDTGTTTSSTASTPKGPKTPSNSKTPKCVGPKTPKSNGKHSNEDDANDETPTKKKRGARAMKTSSVKEEQQGEQKKPMQSKVKTEEVDDLEGSNE